MTRPTISFHGVRSTSLIKINLTDVILNVPWAMLWPLNYFVDRLCGSMEWSNLLHGRYVDLLPVNFSCQNEHF